MKRLLITCTTAILLLSAFNTKKKSRLKLPAEFILVRGGTIHLGPDTCCVHENNPSKRITVSSFYISKYEVTNHQYKQFYDEVSAGLTAEAKEKVACDTMGWQQALTYCEPFVNHYYQHPAYKNYPVVNISYYGAVTYCEWLQKKIQAENPNYTIEVKLPDKQQWIYAASGGRGKAIYPWGNYYLRNKKGEFMCNFKRVGDGAIYKNRVTGKPEVAEGSFEFSGTGGLSERTFYTANVKSFYSNDYGLYNVCGNVAEMISEKGIAMGGSWNDYGGDVHIRAETKFESVSPTIGFRPVVTVSEKKKK